jgi:excisionase family DNA binding protein
MTITDEGTVTVDDRRFLTVLELSSYLRVSRRKAYELVANGEVPSIRVGSALRIPRAELDQRLAEAITRLP